MLTIFLKLTRTFLKEIRDFKIYIIIIVLVASATILSTFSPNNSILH